MGSSSSVCGSSGNQESAANHTGSQPNSAPSTPIGERKPTGNLSENRKLKAAKLGRKCVFNVEISKAGFSVQKIDLCEGQMIGFTWNDHEGPGFNVTQVIHDGVQYKPVPGGFNSGSVKRKGTFEQQFNLHGTYKFVSAGIHCTPLVVKVDARASVRAQVSDKGFQPSVIRLDEGNDIHWSWNKCSIEHSVHQVDYLMVRGVTHPINQADMIEPVKSRKGKTGEFNRNFSKPGLFYFQTEGSRNGDEKHTCMVHVRERQREFRIHVSDSRFDPQMIKIEDGDRLWWHWDKNRCKRPHCIFQVNCPPIDHIGDESFRPVKKGFHWSKPSYSGLLSHEFHVPGVYYFSDYSYTRGADYIGTVIVKPKQPEHFLTIHDNRFDSNIINVKSGDSVWWRWNIENSECNIRPVSKTVCPIDNAHSKLEEKEFKDNHSRNFYLSEALTDLKVTAGFENVQIPRVGVYLYKLASEEEALNCCLIAQGGVKNKQVKVSDVGFEPKVALINNGDCLWWTWQNCVKSHNIVQVTHEGQVIENGFYSGIAVSPPSAFMCRFSKPGVYYYYSDGVSKMFGAVVVRSHPKTHVIGVSSSKGIFQGITVVNINDVVAWRFEKMQKQDLVEISSIDKLDAAQKNAMAISPRYVLSKVMTDPGIFHFTGKGFSSASKKGEAEAISTVVVDDIPDQHIVRIDSLGFHPPTLNIQEGESVLWTWKDSTEDHNVINVEPRLSDHEPLAEVKGERSFNSGRPVPHGNFLHTFNEVSRYEVMSQGANRQSCRINVHAEGEKCPMPSLREDDSDKRLEPNSRLYLNCMNSKAVMYYTTDGTSPNQWRKSGVEKYNHKHGVKAVKKGLFVIRAIAVDQLQCNSDIFTSHRYWVTADGTPDTPEKCSSDVGGENQKEMWQWWSCTPAIKAYFTQAGTMEVHWDSPPEESRSMIQGYQLFLNGISYCEMFPATYTNVQVAGMAGGNSYEVNLVAYPHDTYRIPIKSNKLMMKTPRVTSSGGPVISLQMTKEPGQLIIVWNALSKIEGDIVGYRVYLNGQKCGNQVTPDEESDRCKVIIEGCRLDQPLSITVAAVPKDETADRISNELVVTLPLNAAIEFPSTDRVGSSDMYNEYLEVRKGSGYIPSIPHDEDHQQEVEAWDPNVAAEKRHSRVAVISLGNLVADKPEPEEVRSSPFDRVVVGKQDGQENFLPAPLVSLTNRSSDRVVVSWLFDRSAAPEYRCFVNTVSVIGKSFNSRVNSDMSFECIQDLNGNAEHAVEHRWNVTSGSECILTGLLAGQAYDISVVAKYNTASGAQSCELQASSEVKRLVTLGPPPPPKLYAIAVDLYQATLEWDIGEFHPDINLGGFRVLVDNRQIGDLLNKTTRKTTIDCLQPDHSVSVNIVATTPHDVGDSGPSNTVKIVCPSQPPKVKLTQQPSYKKGTVVIAWQKNADPPAYAHEIVFYRLYVDGAWHGEVRATPICEQKGYQYYMTNLEPGVTHEVIVKCYSGQSRVEKEADQVNCLCESDPSDPLTVSCPAPPKSPVLRIDGMHPDGIDITWDMPQQYGEASVSGYQLLKNGQLYGAIVPPEVNRLHISDAKLGETLELQILALTDHPVGRHHRAMQDADNNDDSGFESGPGFKDIYIGDRYSACKPGPKLTITYAGLVQPSEKVWTDKVTGHSAIVAWRSPSRPAEYYTAAESFLVTWWKDDDPEKVQSQETRDDHLQVFDLEPNTKYKAVVQSRRTQKYADIRDNVVDDGYNNTFILNSKSSVLSLKTSRPPPPPASVSVISTTVSAVLVGWDMPKAHGVDVVGYRLDAVPVHPPHQPRRHCCAEVLPDRTSGVVDGLQEKTEYMLLVSMVTSEYFDRLPEGHELARSRKLPNDRAAPEDAWLPSASMIVTTSGTSPPSDVRVKSTEGASVLLSWSPPIVFGSNRLEGTVVRWCEHREKFASEDVACHKLLPVETTHAQITDFKAGLLYRISVEAVVSVKIVLDANSRSPDVEKGNRRTTHVASERIFFRARAPCEAPVVLVTGYTENAIQLNWDKPLLYKEIGKDSDGNSKIMKLALEGYRLEVNSNPHMRLSPSTLGCTLIKCKPNRIYKIVLVALTCTEEVRKQRKLLKQDRPSSLESKIMAKDSSKAWHTGAEDLENDESYSDVVQVSLPPVQDGALVELEASHKPPLSKKSEEPGSILLKWHLSGPQQLIDHFNITWTCLADGATEKLQVDSSKREEILPVKKRKCIYDVLIEPDFLSNSVMRVIPQPVQVMITGPPDPPVIFTREVNHEGIVIEWAEPRMYGVPVSGYQVYLNGRKVGNDLSNLHRRAVIPCKEKSSYRVCLVAVSSEMRFSRSSYSNTLVISTGPDGLLPYQATTASIADKSRFVTLSDNIDESPLKVKVVRVDEESMSLNWDEYNESSDLQFYKVIWQSSIQPIEREVRLLPHEKSVVIHKCYPGSVHRVQVIACGSSGRIVDVSNKLTVQTSGAPDQPIVKVKALNFKYVTIEWGKSNSYGEAEVSGYKVYVNGIVVAHLGPNELSYSYDNGKWCRKYSFQVQALSTNEKLSSRPSEPIVITWPGLQPPMLHQVTASSPDVLKLAWDRPLVTDGVQVKGYRLVCQEADTKREVKVINDIPGISTEVEVRGLMKASYVIYLEVQVHGCGDVVRSELLHVTPNARPAAPHVAVEVLGLQDRRNLDRIACDLINKRDKLLSQLGNRDRIDSDRTAGSDDKASGHELGATEDCLDSCLALISSLSDHVTVHVSWTPARHSPLPVTGFKLLVDGREHGDLLTVQEVRVKLLVAQASHKICVVAVAQQVSSIPSNEVEVLTEPFQPFSFFMFSSCNGRQSYAEALSTERRQAHLINKGIVNRQVAPPKAMAFAIFEGQYLPIYPRGSPSQHTVIYFWNPHNACSKRMLSWFIKFAEKNSSKLSSVTVACCAEDQETMIQMIRSQDLYNSSSIRHFTDACQGSGRKVESLSKQFSVIGVPMFVVVHSQDYVAWRGRFCANNIESFEHFMHFIIAQVDGKLPSGPDPWNVEINTALLDEMCSSNSRFLQLHQGKSILPTGRVQSSRLTSRSKRSEKKISVMSRPYSGPTVPVRRSSMKLSSRGSK